MDTIVISYLKGSSPACLTSPVATRYSTWLRISLPSMSNISDMRLYSSSNEPSADRSRLRPTVSDSMNTLHFSGSNTCYFKSTDGHAENWSFSTARINLHLALLAGVCCFWRHHSSLARQPMEPPMPPPSTLGHEEEHRAWVTRAPCGPGVRRRGTCSAPTRSSRHPRRVP
jgi:hypothetical protein